MPHSTDDLGDEQCPKTSLFARGGYPVIHIYEKPKFLSAGCSLEITKCLIDKNNLAGINLIFHLGNSHLRKKFPVLMFQLEAISEKLFASSTLIGFTLHPRSL